MYLHRTAAAPLEEFRLLAAASPLPSAIRAHSIPRAIDLRMIMYLLSLHPRGGEGALKNGAFTHSKLVGRRHRAIGTSRICEVGPVPQ
jgi:hypothetical protein